MNIESVKQQAQAQGGRIKNASMTPWRSTNGVTMTEVLAAVEFQTRGGFATFRQWARKEGAVERDVYNVDAEALQIAKTLTEGTDKKIPENFAERVTDRIADGKVKYAVVQGLLLLAREAWGDPTLSTMRERLGWRVYCWPATPRELYEDAGSYSPAEAEAIVAALVAAAEGV